MYLCRPALRKAKLMRCSFRLVLWRMFLFVRLVQLFDFCFYPLKNNSTLKQKAMCCKCGGYKNYDRKTGGTKSPSPIFYRFFFLLIFFPFLPLLFPLLFLLLTPFLLEDRFCIWMQRFVYYR